jgi:PAS domain S-box-containing protein
MFIICLIIISALIQLTAAILALRLIKLTGRKLSWSLIAFAMILQAVRRINVLVGLIDGDFDTSQVVLSEWLGLAVSVLMLIGVARFESFLRKSDTNNKELKQAEDRLIESELKFNKLYFEGPFGMVIADEKFMFKKANPVFCDILGYSESELQNFTFMDVSHPDDKETNQLNIQKLIRKEISVYKTEKRYIRKDGQAIWGSLTVTANYDKDGSFLYNLGIIEDITGLRQTQEELRQRESKLGTLLNLLPVGVSILDQDQKIVYENPALESILDITMEGLQRGDYRKRTYLRNDGTPKPPEEFASSRVFSQKKALYNVITGIVKEDGNTVWTNVNAVPVDFPDWKVILVTADITGLKLIEKELKQSEEYLKLGYETANLGIWKNDLKTMTVEFDERARVHYGFNESVVALSDVLARIHPDDRGKLLKEIEKSTSPSGTGKYSTEYRVIHPDGSEHWLYIGVRVIFEGEGESRRAVMGYGTSLDITERKQREETLRKLEYLLSEGQKIGHIGTFEYVIDTQTTYWSAEEYSIYGLDPAGPSPTYEVILAKCIHPDDAALLNETFTAAIQSRSVYELDHRIVKPDGSIRWVFDRAHPYFDLNGKLVRYVGSTLDITERKYTEEKIRKMNEELERRVIERTSQLETANKELEAFSYSVSHDLRAPLRGINGFSQLLMEDFAPKLDDEAKRICTVIHQNSQKMGQLIDELLAFSRLGRAEMQLSEVEMSKLIQSIYQEYTDAGTRERIELNVSDICNATGDPTMLRQVWTNLFLNAVKYSSKKEKSIITITCKKENNKSIYCIRDNGVGFDMAYANKLFGVFQRLHSSKEFEGTGVGLAIVQRIIRKHGGEVWAEGKVNHGASFYFSLPVITNGHHKS